jgi:thiol-disulfide isomerase/thioredoxin
MKRFALIAALALLSGIGVGSLRADDKAATPRTKDQILADIDAVKLPQVDREKTKDPTYVKQFIQDRNDAIKKRSELTAELYKVAPDAPQLDKLLPERWNMLPDGPDKTVAEIDQYLTSHPKSAEIEQISMLRAQIQVHMIAKTTAERLAAVDTLTKNVTTAKGKDMTASLLYTTSQLSKDSAEKKELADRILREYPKSPVVARVEADRKLGEAVGKPMVLAFNDAITGKPMSMEGLKGKIVVMDFWATWCGPCVAEMPKMKKLYAEYKDKGVEFLGISLDQPEDKGGLKALKEFCAKNEITWPQYYQGNFWQSEFSSKLGINSIPCVFVVGPDGIVLTTEGRGNLETILPEQIKKRGDKVAGE